MNVSTRPQQKGPAQAFRMPIDDVRAITGRGTLVTGTVQQGAVKSGDAVEIVGAKAKPISSVVLAVEISGKLVGRAGAGNAVGVLLRGVNPDEIMSGEVLQAP
jgi:elongation factor Tu